MRTSLALALLLPLALGSCGGSADPGALVKSGHTALGAGDYDQARSDFEAALELIDVSHDQFLSAKLGAVEALIRENAEQAKDEFLTFASELPAEVTDEDFSYVGQKFAGAQEFSAAIDILDAGMKKYKESAELVQLKDNIRGAAERAGNQAALDKMAGLGYL